MRESKGRGKQRKRRMEEGWKRRREGGSNRRTETGRNGRGDKQGLEVGVERERVLKRTAKVFHMRKSLKVEIDKTLT